MFTVDGHCSHSWGRLFQPMPDLLISLKHSLNIILPYTATSSIQPPSLRFPNQNYVCAFYTAMNATFSKFNVVKQLVMNSFFLFTLPRMLIPLALMLMDLCPIRTHYPLRKFQALGMTVSKRTLQSRNCPGRQTARTGRQRQWGRNSRKSQNLKKKLLDKSTVLLLGLVRP
jgi:hypothetical protein